MPISIEMPVAPGGGSTLSVSPPRLPVSLFVFSVSVPSKRVISRKT
jgi:hypothetical protein